MLIFSTIFNLITLGMNILFSLQVRLQDILFEINLHKKKNYYTLHSLHVFSLGKSVQLILQISATYRLVNYLLAGS